MTAIALSLLVALAVNGAFFAVAAARRTDVVTDLSYSLTFALLAIVVLFTGARAPVQLVVALLVLVWAVRLGAYRFRRILRLKVDHRFDGMRDEPLRFARFWLLQAITAAVVMLPASYLLDRDHPPALGARAAAGVAVWLAGMVIETVADAQKSAFEARDENRGRFVASGLWRCSRHPSYFGELLVWWGLFLYAVPVLHGAAFAVVAGPLFNTLLSLFVSGIPPLERSADGKHGSDPAYRDYKRRTSILVPLPPRASSRAAAEVAPGASSSSCSTSDAQSVPPRAAPRRASRATVASKVSPATSPP